MAKSPEDGMASLIRNLEEKTGRGIDAWVAIARGAKLAKHAQVVAFLKKEHGLTHGYANQIALRALAADDAPAAGSDDLVAAQYAGPKARLRPLYDTIAAAVRKFGTDIEFAPKGRLEASGTFNSMVTHRVRLETAAEVSAELIAWLRQAYDQA